MSKNALIVSNSAESYKSGAEVWLRIAAFLDLKSVNTQHTYLGIIKEWSEFLGDLPGTDKAAALILRATDLHAVAYKKWLEKKPGQKPRFGGAAKSGKGKDLALAGQAAAPRDGTQSTLANATLSKKFAALRRIYRMLIGAGLLARNPFDSDQVPPPPARSGQKRPTEMIEFAKVKELFTLPDTATPKGRRDLALLTILFGGALRRSEAVKIKIGDVRKTMKGTVFVRLRATKARKDAEQALPKWAADNIKIIIADREEQGAGQGDYLFNSYRGPAGLTPTAAPLSDSGLYKLFKQYCARAGINPHATPHSARATAITKLLSDGLSHREVQEFSRHASIQMVEVYDKRRIGVDENPAKDLDF